MKLKKLIIYGYGFLQNTEINFDSSFHVIYGENEAGKSTVLSFIETMLFGFPKRQQSELRYEPKSGGRHGGKLIASIDSYGLLTIERIHNREPEESLIFLNNEQLSEQGLHRLLQKMDRPLFQQLFSTKLEHLRAMEKLNEDDFNRYLLGTSLSSHLTLYEMEQSIITKQNELYRPHGRKPIINAMATELNRLEVEIKKSASLKEDYEQKAQEKTKLQKRLNDLQAEKKQAQADCTLYEKVETVAPLYETIQLEQLKLAERPHISSFPENGQARYEQLKEKMLDLEAEMETRHQRITQLEQSLPVVNEEWLLETKAVEWLRERSESYQIKLEQRLKTSEQMKHLEQNINDVLEQFGPDWTYSHIENANVSLAEQEKLEAFIVALEELTEDRNNLKKELDLKRKQYFLMQEKVENINETCLSNEERQALQNELANVKNEHIEHELLFLQKGIERYDEELRQTSKGSFKPFVFTLVTGFVLTALFFFINEQPLFIFIIPILTGCAALFVYKSEQKKRERYEWLLKLKHEEETRFAQLRSEVQQIDQREFELVKEKLAYDDERRKESALLKENMQSLQSELERVEKELEELTFSLETKRKEAEQWAQIHQFPTTVTYSHWLQLFHELKQAKRQAQELERLKREQRELERWLHDYERSIYEHCKLFRLEQSENVTSLLLKISRLLEAEKAKKTERTRILTQIEEEKSQLKWLQEKRVHYENERKRLFELANCESEDRFFEYGKYWDEQREIEEKINDLERQIHIQIRDEKERKMIETLIKTEHINPVLELQQLTERLHEMEREEAHLRQQIANLQAEMTKIEEGGEYDEKRQQFEMKKTELRQHALEWGTYAVALHLLKKTKERFRHERLPNVIERANEYFSKMTKGAYKQLSVPVDGETFYVESSTGVRFTPKELSRGTQEQLYLSIRLALANAYPSHIHFPVILDDIFVHFDEERRRAALTVMKEYANDHQVLLFTCHKPIVAECHVHPIRLEKQ